MYTLTEAQIQNFHDKGWIGPLDVFTEAEVASLKECLEFNSTIKVVDGQPMMMFYNNVMNISTSRDLHLFHKPITDFFTNQKIVRILNQLGEPDLLMWRSNVFCKMPGEGEIKWHQVYDSYNPTGYNEEKSTLVYTEEKDFLNLTVWVALDHATLESGCVHFANGTHKHKFGRLQVPSEEGMFAGVKVHKMVWQGGKQYSEVFDFDDSQWEVEAVPAKPGQIIIFTERCMHYSPGNNSNQRRLGINARYIHPNVKIYPHRLKGDFIDENSHNIERHFSILVSGHDDYGINRVRERNDLDETEVEFQNMTNLIRFEHVELPRGKQQIEIDSLYQQAIEGDCTVEEPNPILHARKYIEWQAWKKLEGMSRTEAMEKYSRLVASLPRKHSQLTTLDEESHDHNGSVNGLNPGVIEIQEWLVVYLAELLKEEQEQIDITVPFDRYGLGSIDATSLIGDLEAWLEQELPPTLLFNYPTIQTLAENLAGKNKVLVNI
ncbi:MAG: acyl-CoA-binding protein [Calothrix sp. MO_167.B12]|nr:acyl-CoA-binding protein [Calothrix sp. MO_167.B12]